MFWRRKRPDPPGILVFGLGNPGIDYVRTRHNVGWWVLDELARRLGVDSSASRHRSQVDYCRNGDLRLALIKPTTFMNRSGFCVYPWTKEFADTPWLVVYDDITMAPGKLRLRKEGSAGGHKGIKSIIDIFDTNEFIRLKVGVGKPPSGAETSDWVLEPPGPADEDLIAQGVQRAADAVLLIAEGKYDEAMHLMGSNKPEPEKKADEKQEDGVKES